MKLIFYLPYLYIKHSCSHIKMKRGNVFNLLIYFPRWYYSNLNNKSSFDNRIPWLTFQSIAYLKMKILSGMKVFEYGSGGSTLFFLDKGCNVTSSEHDIGWFCKLSKVISSDNWFGKHYEPTFLEFDSLAAKPNKDVFYDYDIKIDPSFNISNNTLYWDKSFVDYVSSIDQFPDYYFDIILIDGRCRFSCWRRCKDKLKKGGLIILDNAERPNYSSIIEEIRNLGWKENNFFGPGPFSQDFWATIIWES
jgi:hypothetical protein